MRRSFFEAKHAELESQLFAPHREAFPAGAFSLEAFLWAVASVRSRVHPPLDGAAVALVPVADLVGTCMHPSPQSWTASRHYIHRPLLSARRLSPCPKFALLDHLK